MAAESDTDRNRTLLDLPVGHGARALIRAHLAAAKSACDRLDDIDDIEALHDFRVALRRTRSVLRAYRPWLGKVLSKRVRRLKRLARSTNGARDAEVMLAWQRTERRLRAQARPGFAWLEHWLVTRCETAYEELRRELPGKFQRIEQRLLSNLDDEPPASHELLVVFRAVTADLIQGHVAELIAALEPVNSIDDFEQVHEARICGKRLRYLIEPLHALPSSRAIVRALKRYQDRLGELCDAHVQAAVLHDAAVLAASTRARRRLAHALGQPKLPPVIPRGVSTALELLATRLGRLTEERFATVSYYYLSHRLAQLTRPIDRLVSELRQVSSVPTDGPRT